MQPAGEIAQLGVGLVQLVVGEAQDVGGLRGRRQCALGDLEQIPDGQQPLLRAVVQIAADTPALGIGGLDDTCTRVPQRGGLTATLELGRRSRREDTHRGDIIVRGLHRPRVHHRHMTEVRAIGSAQANREVALKAHVDRRLGLWEARRELLRKRDDRSLHDERARLAAGVVLEWLLHPIAVEPAAEHPHVLPVRVGGLCDEGELGPERERDVADQAAKELVSDRTRGALGNGAKQVPAAGPCIAVVDVGERRHVLRPGIDASEPTCPRPPKPAARRNQQSHGFPLNTLQVNLRNGSMHSGEVLATRRNQHGAQTRKTGNFRPR